MTRKVRVDWARVERQYRAGLFSNKEIALDNNVHSESLIRYHAKRLGWKKDLSSEVRQRTRTKMVENLASAFEGPEIVNKIKQIEDEEIIEQAARTQVQVVREHQKTLGQGHALTLRMLSELDATTSCNGELQDMIKSDVAPVRQRAMQNAVSLSARATTLRDLATAARTWVILERQAFSIADDNKDDKNQRKLDEMTAEQLRAEILNDPIAQQLGLTDGLGIPTKTTNGSGKVH